MIVDLRTMKQQTLCQAKVLGIALVALAGCGGSPPAVVPPPPPPSAETSPAPAPSSSALVDPLGPRPLPGAPPAFQPKSPEVLTGPGNSKVWLLERHGLPLVTVGVVVPYGSAAEPAEKAGLAFATADMLDEGAGKLDALAFSQAVNDLGARLSTHADRDSSLAAIEVLSSKLDQALPLLADAVMRPRHEKKEWTRVSALWMNALKNRANEPEEVARVVTSLLFYGDQHPYGHPPDGTLGSAKKIQLADIVAWHRKIWRPDQATFIVVGDITAAQLTSLLSKSFADWKAPDAPPLAVASPPAVSRNGVRTFVVDRSDAPQVIMSLARSGPPASDPFYPKLEMLNIALGGSFTSRLNQNLREDHGWTYGARSRFNSQRGAGMFVVRAAIRANAIGEALGETTKEVGKMAQHGVSQEELDKLRALVNGSALDAYATLHGVAGTLASNAALGLPPDQNAKELASQLSATTGDLAKLAAQDLDLSSAIVVLVGPQDLAVKALTENKLPAPEMVDAEGHPAGRSSGAP